MKKYSGKFRKIGIISEKKTFVVIKIHRCYLCWFPYLVELSVSIYPSKHTLFQISLSKITAMKMRLFHMQNNSETHNSPCSINQQILNTQLLCHGARKVRESLRKDESPNEKVLRETEQTILVLNEKLDLLSNCCSQKE